MGNGKVHQYRDASVRKAVLTWLIASLLAYLYMLVIVLLLSNITDVGILGIFLRGLYIIAPVIFMTLIAPLAISLLFAQALHLLAWAATIIAIVAPILHAYIVISISDRMWSQGLAVEGWAVFIGSVPAIGTSILLNITGLILLLRTWDIGCISTRRYITECSIMATPLMVWLLAAAWILQPN